MNRPESSFDAGVGYEFLYSVAPFDLAGSFSRKLREDYAGSAFEAEESGGSTLADIGFTDDFLIDQATLTSHVGANNGFVTTLYDQGAGALDWTESDSGKKPPIVTGGSIENISGFVAANFSADDHRLQGALNSLTQPYTLFMVFQQNTTGLSGNRRFVGPAGSGASFQYYTSSSTGNVVASAGTTQQIYPEDTNYNLISILVDGANSVVRLNGSQVFTGNLGTNPTSGLTIGRWYLNATLAYATYFKMNEFVAYDSDVSSQFSDLESNFMNFYPVTAP